MQSMCALAVLLFMSAIVSAQSQGSDTVLEKGLESTVTALKATELDNKLRDHSQVTDKEHPLALKLGVQFLNDNPFLKIIGDAVAKPSDKRKETTELKAQQLDEAVKIKEAALEVATTEVKEILAEGNRKAAKIEADEKKNFEAELDEIVQTKEKLEKLETELNDRIEEEVKKTFTNPSVKLASSDSDIRVSVLVPVDNASRRIHLRHKKYNDE